ncbi:MAG: hypothetical protein KAS65_12520 [Candidatus Aminicenantes bacterium]|nr:hypothetical protein [Candidatus Aminicenantes bacterium]
MKNQNLTTWCCYCNKLITEGEGRYLVIKDVCAVYSCMNCYLKQPLMKLPPHGSSKSTDDVQYCSLCKNKIESSSLSHILMKQEEIIYFCIDCARNKLKKESLPDKK